MINLLIFQYLFVSNHSSTIQEIDLIVKYNLKRETRKIFYYPSIGHLRVSHRETYEDYRDRIFSKKIIDLENILIKPTIIKIKSNKINNFVDVIEEECISEESRSNSESESDTDKEDSDYESEVEVDNESEIESVIEEPVSDYESECDYSD